MMPRGMCRQRARLQPWTGKGCSQAWWKLPRTLTARAEKFHTCGGPRRRPGLGEGRGRRICFTKLVSFVAFPGAYLLFSRTRAIFGVKVFGRWMMVVSGLCTYFQCLAVMIDYIFEEGLDSWTTTKSISNVAVTR